MTPQVKQRIEQIRRGEVPEGYKKTKVGIVPDEWNEECLGKYLQEYKELSNDIENYPVYSSSRQGLIPQSQYYDNREAVETNLGYKIVPNGYVTYRHMSDDDIFHFNVNQTGSAVLVSSEYPVFTSTKKGDLGYLIPMLNGTARFRYFCRTQKMGGTRTRLYYKNLCTYKTAFATLPEQKKIAKILSAQDKIIALKEKLIEEKKRQKKHLMQQILNNKAVKSKFSSHWNTVELNDVFDYVQPTKYLVESTDYSNAYTTPVLTAGKSFVLGYTNETNGIYDQVPVVIFDDFTTDSKYVDFPFKAKSSAMKILKAKTNYDIKFAFELLQNINYIVGGHERHWISIFSQLTVDVPPYEAQLKISKIIQNTDKEIELLEKDLIQEKQKKKALMQLLLTGIVRV